MAELKPCPFCGGKSIDPEGGKSADASGPVCDGCGASAQSVKRWNTRADSIAAAVRAENAACLDAVESIDVSPDSRADEALIAAADAIRARRDGVLMTAEEWKARDSLAIAAAVQAEREAIKAHIGADDFQPDLSIDRGDLNRGAAWGRGVGAVIDYVDSRNQSPAVDVLAKPDAIESTPSVRGGALCVKGTRFPVSHLLADTASGETLPKICERYGLVLRDARRAIEQVASWVDQKNNLVDGAAAKGEGEKP